MFFIFGFGKKTIKEMGTLGKVRCSNCGNVREWCYKKVTTWFTLFFIPVIPYNVVYVKECPICNTAIIVDKSQVTQQDGSTIAQENSDVELTDVQRNYRDQIEEFKRK